MSGRMDVADPLDVMRKVNAPLGEKSADESGGKVAAIARAGWKYVHSVNNPPLRVVPQYGSRIT